MSDPARELAHEWLIRAEHDLRVARYLLTMPDPPPESVGFHAQQCAEKGLEQFRAGADELIDTLCCGVSLSRCHVPDVSGVGGRGGGHRGAYLCFHPGSVGLERLI